MSNDHFQFMTGHKVFQNHKDENLFAIEFTDPPYQGIIISYGKVKFPDDLENAETCTISFDYEVIDDKGIEYDVNEFEKYIGDFLLELIAFQLSRNEVVYTGGTSENRDDDIIESDI